jgi:REP element-mobilizing transposase RayT
VCWKWLAKQYSYVDLDEWIVMPNHLHGILVITNRMPPPPLKRKTLGRLVGAFKTVSTDWRNQQRGTPGAPMWQRDFYDHIIRDEDELNKIREYIRTNPLRWESDPDFT